MLKLLKQVVRKARAKLQGKTTYKQELLLLMALKEKGFDIKTLNIKCDHLLGLNYVNEVEMSIKYPDSFYDKCVHLIPAKKTYNFYFKGNMSESGRREVMLSPFLKMPDSAVIGTNEGRVQSRKDKYDHVYFSELAKAKYGLCPNQADWPGDKDRAWTYRFIEACFVDAIPVLFNEAPLGKKFIDGFHFLLDSEINKNGTVQKEFNAAEIQSNRVLAKKRFCITDEECNLIRSRTI